MVNIEEGVTMEGDATGTRYDVLVTQAQSEMPGHDRIECKLWISQKTKMLDKIEWCDPKVRSKFGSYSHISFKYTQCDGIYVPTEIIGDFPDKANHFTEKYSNITIRKRAAGV